MNTRILFSRFAMFRPCRSCRGGVQLAVPGDQHALRAWIDEHEDLVDERAQAVQGHRAGAVDWTAVDRCEQAIGLHRLVAPGGCDECGGSGQVPRQRQRRDRRRRTR